MKPRGSYNAGQRHPLAKLTDRDVELMRQLAEGGTGTRSLAAKFEVSRRTVRDILAYRKR